MSTRRQCEFQLLRYVPDPVRNEFVHIGVIVRDAGAEADGAGLRVNGADGGRARAAGNSGAEGAGARGHAGAVGANAKGAGANAGGGAAGPAMAVKFTRDWRRVRCLDAEADIAVLEGMETELRQLLSGDSDGRIRKILDEALSLNVQLTEPKAYLAESLALGVDELMRLYVEPPPREKVSRVKGRAAIQQAMRGAFEQAGVWDLMRKAIRASQYTRPGDPLRIDCGYRPNGVIRMFHAVSLDAGVEMAKVLAFSAAGLAAGIERVEKARLDLAAIVEPMPAERDEDDGERRAQYRFGVETMEEHSIRVLTTGDLPRVAEAARRELIRE